MSETIMTPFTWREVSEDRYMEMLEILWPAAWEPERGFLVVEAWDHKLCSVTGAVDTAAFAAFMRRGGKFYECLQPMTRQEWKAFDIHSMVMAETA
jgi:hypothetical protein